MIWHTSELKGTTTRPPYHLWLHVQVSLRSRGTSTSWEEAKQAVKRRSFELDSRSLIPPELERARHATEDVDTPAVSPRALSPRLSWSRERSFGYEDVTL